MLTAVPKAAAPGVSWPAVPEPNAANLLAVQYQLGHSQWWPEALLRERQFVQLNELVGHAFRTVPFYRERLAAAGYREGERLTPELWAALPVLRRDEVQETGAELNSRELPPRRGKAFEVATSGSTGTPVKVLRTELNNLFWFACILRERLWHRLDGGKKFCAIREVETLLGPEDKERAAYPGGLTLETWADTYGYVFPTSPSALLPIRTDIPLQVEWLQRQRRSVLELHRDNVVDGAGLRPQLRRRGTRAGLRQFLWPPTRNLAPQPSVEPYGAAGTSLAVCNSPWPLHIGRSCPPAGRA